MKFLPLFNRILARFKKPSDPSSFQNILVVSNTGLGDTLLSTPAIKSLYKSFPQKNIYFLVNSKVAPLFVDYQYSKENILYTGKPLNLLKIIYTCRQYKIDTIFLFHSNGPEDIFISLMSGARNILKVTYDKNHKFKKLFLNPPVKAIKHNIESKLDLIRLFKPSHIDTTMEISSSINTNNVLDSSIKQKIIGFQLGTQDLYKIWPIENFIELFYMIMKFDSSIHIMLFGHTKLEQKLAKTFLEKTKVYEKNITNLCAKTTLEQLNSAIKQLNLLISGDTGTMHLAIANHIPTICLFSPTNSKVFGPYQDQTMHRVIQKEGNFINQIKNKKERNQSAMELINFQEVFSLMKNFISINV